MRCGFSKRLFRFSRAMFEHARDQQRLVRALVARPGAGPVLGNLQQVLGDTVRAELTTLATRNRGCQMEATKS